MEARNMLQAIFNSDKVVISSLAKKLEINRSYLQRVTWGKMDNHSLKSIDKINIIKEVYEIAVDENLIILKDVLEMLGPFYLKRRYYIHSIGFKTFKPSNLYYTLYNRDEIERYLEVYEERKEHLDNFVKTKSKETGLNQYSIRKIYGYPYEVSISSPSMMARYEDKLKKGNLLYNFYLKKLVEAKKQKGRDLNRDETASLIDLVVGARHPKLHIADDVDEKFLTVTTNWRERLQTTNQQISVILGFSPGYIDSAYKSLYSKAKFLQVVKKYAYKLRDVEKGLISMQKYIENNTADVVANDLKITIMLASKIKDGHVPYLTIRRGMLSAYRERGLLRV